MESSFSLKYELNVPINPTIYECTRKSDSKKFAARIMPQCTDVKLQIRYQHSHIISIVEVFDEKDKVIVILEWADRGNLQQFIDQRQNKLIEENKVRKIFIQILQSVRSLHSNKIVHRRIRTQNVLFVQKKVKLCDVAFVKQPVVNQVEPQAESEQNVCLKSAPEMFGGVKFISTEQADVWGLGVILFQLLTLQAPFQSLQDIRDLKFVAYPMRSHYSNQLIEIMYRCFNYDPALRPSVFEIISQVDNRILFKSDQYIGELKESVKDGLGTYYHKNGDKFEGGYRSSLREGFGIYLHKNRDRYEGNYIQGKKCGQGKYFYASGDKFTGNYKDDKKHGKGSYVYASGTTFVGEYLNDKKSGYGIYTSKDGDSYEGQYLDGHKHGFGKAWFAATGSYEGEFLNGETHGKGIFKFLNGEEYQGNFQNGKAHGQGIYIYNNGDRYMGEYQHGCQTGEGIYCRIDGKYYEGIFQNGKLKDRRIQKSDMYTRDF